MWVARSKGRRWLVWLLGLSGLAAGVAWFAGDRWSRAELVRVEREIKDGRTAAARVAAGRGWRGWVSAGWRRSTGEAPARRRRGTSMRRWRSGRRVPPGTSRYANATLRRARLAIDRGRFAVAEEALEPSRKPFPTR